MTQSNLLYSVSGETEKPFEYFMKCILIIKVITEILGPGENRSIDNEMF